MEASTQEMRFRKMYDRVACLVNDTIQRETGYDGISNDRCREIVEGFLAANPGSREVLDSFQMVIEEPMPGEPYLMRLVPSAPGRGWLSTTILNA